MLIWEKAVLNIQKGARKVAAVAAVLSERVKTEINIARLRIKAEEVRSRIDELHRIIGRKVEMLKRGDAMPQTSEQLLKDEDIEASLTELGERKQEFEEVQKEMQREQEAFKSLTKHVEDKAE
jgi:alcohol dehydrogenase class IV